MQTVTTIGFDIAKSVFEVHGVDANGVVVIRRQLRRRYVLAFFQKLPSCLIGIEACASSHFWARELSALGHIPRLMPPAYVKPYVKRQRMTQPMPRRSAKQLPEQRCGSSRSRRPSSKVA
jgi:transposase